MLLYLTLSFSVGSNDIVIAIRLGAIFCYCYSWIIHNDFVVFYYIVRVDIGTVERRTVERGL